MAIGWAMVGTGRHASERIAPALRDASDTRLAAVCSRDESRAREFANQFGFARAYGSYDEMLRDRDVDVVYISTPNALHAEHTIMAARAGKHVLVEKPMALHRVEAEEMIQECEERGVRLGVGYHYRVHPAHVEARRIITSGEIGRTVLFDARNVATGTRREGWWQDPAMAGAYIMTARGVHLLDLICYLAGQEPEAVTMMTDGRPAEARLEGTSVATLRFPGDSFATVAVSRHTSFVPNSFSVYGTHGFLQGTETVGLKPFGGIRLVTSGGVTEKEYGKVSLYRDEVEAFNRAVQGGESPIASGAEGLRVVRIMEALLESAREGGTKVVR